MLFLRFSRKKCSGIFADIILILFFILIAAYFADIAKSKTYEFSFKSLTNKSKWTNFLKGTVKKRWKTFKNLSRFKGLPKIPKIFPSQLLKPDSKHSPCVVAKTNCLNGGICMSVGNEWYCECPKSHYGRFCEFVADQTHCEENLCRNNATCYSIEHYRKVSNPDVTEVEACAKRKMMDNNNNETCHFSLNIKYMCWCKYGYEGAFCEFTEGMRCCAEDHCNYHGLIKYKDVFVKKKGKFDLKQLKYKFKPVCDEVVCTCLCEEFFSAEDNCSTPDPCRDVECINGGKCKTNVTDKTPECECQKNDAFIAPTDGIVIRGDRCEIINVTDDDKHKDCIPCKEGIGYESYIKCMRKSLPIDISNYFAKECFVNGKRKRCISALKTKFCLNNGICEASVSNFTLFIKKPTKRQLRSPLFLIPKCECPLGYEGDFCENRVLDECDRRDIEEHKNYLEEFGITNKLLLNFSQEGFIQTLKNRLGWKPKYYEKRKDAEMQGLEKALRDKGMKTYCGQHGFCRPYIEKEGMSCKCDIGYTGPRCELLDPCVPNPCKEDETCIEFPVVDDSVEESELTYVCNS